MPVKVICINTQRIHDLDIKNLRENVMVCPECSHDRKKKHAKCLGYNAEKGIGHCNHCDVRFVEYRPFENKKQYRKPENVNLTDLVPKALQWFTNRFIGQEAVKKMKVSTSAQYFPQVEKERSCIAFPYYRNGELINVKYRDGEKNFKLESGAELIWYNYDALLNYKEIIIVEGEIDALTWISEGYENVISVPNGANAINMPYLESSLEDLDKVEKFYIATDIDTKGLELRDELVRRLGAERCLLCSFDEHKDINEYVSSKGHKSSQNVLKNAKDIKVDDVYHAKDFLDDIQNLFNNGLKPGLKVGFRDLDEIITWETKRLAVWTGTPQSGKSELLDYVVARLNVLYGWKTAYYSPENFPTMIHFAKLHEKLIGKKFDNKHSTVDEFYAALEHIDDNFFWVSPPEDFTVDHILKKFEYLVKKKGVKNCVIDPFNRIERSNGADKLDYIAGVLIKLSNFAKKHDVLVHLVAHPKKLDKDKGGFYPMATMYDISGSADFWNMSDYGISVMRTQDPETKKFLTYGTIATQKVKFKHLGRTDAIGFKYNYNNGRYEDEQSIIDDWDYSNWIKKEIPLSKLTPENPQNAFNKNNDNDDDDFPF